MIIEPSSGHLKLSTTPKFLSLELVHWAYQYLKFPYSSSKFVKKSAIVCYDFLSLLWHKLRKQWLTFNKFARGTWKFQILLRFCFSEQVLVQDRFMGSKECSLLVKVEDERLKYLVQLYKKIQNIEILQKKSSKEKKDWPILLFFSSKMPFFQVVVKFKVKMLSRPWDGA